MSIFHQLIDALTGATLPPDVTPPANEHKNPRPPRRVKGRGLGLNERDAVWVDKDGDRWRWDESNRVWQNRIRRDGVSTSWYNVPSEWAVTNACYAPYTELLHVTDEPGPAPANTQEHRDHLYLECLTAFGTGNYSRGIDLLNQWLTKTYRWFGDLLTSSAAGEASAHGQRGPSAEESPAPEASPGAGHPSLNRNDLMDAARAVRLYSDQILDPLRPHWDKLATRLEFAAIVAPR